MVFLVFFGFFVSSLTKKYLVAKVLLIVLAISMVMCILYEINIIKSTVLSILFWALDCIFDYVIIVFMALILGDISTINDDTSAVGFIMVLASKSLLFIFSVIIKMTIGRKKSDILNIKEWLMFLICPFITICIFIGISYEFGGMKNYISDIVVLMVVTGMVVINMAEYYMISEIINSQVKLMESDRIRMEMESQKKLYDSISGNYEKQKSMAHEYKNHLQCIDTLIDKKEYDRLKEYVSTLCGKFDSVYYVINTNNPVINAVINTKYQEAIDNDILMSLQVDDLLDMVIDDDDMVVILSNLFNNAIEACKKCNDRIIRFKAVKENNGITISMENSCEGKLSYHDGQIVSTKTDNSEQHGIGIKNVINIVNKYNGEYVIKSDDKKFLFLIAIPENGIIYYS